MAARTLALVGRSMFSRCLHLRNQAWNFAHDFIPRTRLLYESHGEHAKQARCVPFIGKAMSFALRQHRHVLVLGLAPKTKLTFPTSKMSELDN